MKKMILALALLVTTVSLFAQQYTIDPGHTAVTSKVLRFGVVKVVGRFAAVSGTVKYIAADPSSTTAEISVKADSYTANNTEGEKAVKSVGFLDAATYPEIKFSVKKLTKADKQYSVSGTLTIHGVTKEISFPVSIVGPSLDLPTGKQSIGISGMITINRQDYGMSMARKLPNGMDVIGNDVEIEINALAVAQ